MKRKMLALLIVFLFLFTGIANATIFNWGEGDLFRQLKAAFGTTSDGHNHDGTNSRSLGTSTENPTFATNIVAAGFKEGVTNNVSTESTLTSAALAYGYIIKDAADGTVAQNTVGLADGVPGQMVTIKLTLLGTNDYIIDKTCAAVHTTTTDWSTITFNTSGDFVTLLFLDTTNGWIVVYNSGCSIA